MSSMRTAPCDWPLAHCGESGGGAEKCLALDSLTVEMAELVTTMAVEYLWHWTGRQYGTCPITLRPCRETCAEYWTSYRGRGWPTTNLPWFEGSPGPLNPALIGGQWYNLPCGGCNYDPCSCGNVPTISLPGPVASVTQVMIDGEVLDPTNYRIDNHRYLIRLDGEEWPVCQNVLGDPTVVGENGFSVTYQLGITVPAGGRVAAGVLACEMAKAVCGSTSCKLPQRLQSVTRQQVSMTVLDSYGSLYESGTTGLWIVDSWVASINASNRRSGMRVAVPGKRPPRRTT